MSRGLGTGTSTSQTCAVPSASGTANKTPWPPQKRNVAPGACPRGRPDAPTRLCPQPPRRLPRRRLRLRRATRSLRAQTTRRARRLTHAWRVGRGQRVRSEPIALDRVGDGLRVRWLDSVSGPLEREQPCSGDLPGRRLSVLKREQRILPAMDDQCREGDRRQRSAPPRPADFRRSLNDQLSK
jgi:hypothetical protein